MERQRAQKWLKMNKEFDKFSRNYPEKLRRRIFKGIPEALRGAIWQKMLGVEQKIADNRGTYARMLQLGHKYSTDVRQIDNDINR